MWAIRLAVMAGLFFCLLGLPAWAADDQPNNKQGFAAYQAGDYGGAFAAFSRGREAGESHSMRNLGILYVYGQGTARDVQKAHDLFLEAWNKGDAAGGYYLGWMSDGDVEGWPVDRQDALHWYRLAAVKGDIDAQSSLGRYLTEGVAGSVDMDEGAHWYRVAAERGDPTAQFNLGRLYTTEAHYKVDWNECVKWEVMAAETGDKDAQQGAGWCLMRRRGTGDWVESYKWMKLAADQNQDIAVQMLACYNRCEGWPVLTEIELTEAKRRAREFHPRPVDIQ
ncbi:MAG TPA: tetratricopeptide repeat protein [Dongiaceae bacterium]|nr:tetratricopeptide repeat protein [Dongiaceae bacterium]